MAECNVYIYIIVDYRQGTETETYRRIVEWGMGYSDSANDETCHVKTTNTKHVRRPPITIFFFFFTTQRYTKDTSRAPAQYTSSSLYQGETIFTYMGAREGIDVGGICARRNSTPIFGLRGCTRTVFPPPYYVLIIDESIPLPTFLLKITRSFFFFLLNCSLPPSFGG